MKNSGKTRAEILASRVSVLCVAASMVVPQNVYAEGTEENSPLSEHSEETSEVVNSGSEEAPASAQEDTESASGDAENGTEAIASEPAEQVNPVQSEKTEQKQEVQAQPEIRQVILKRTIEFKDVETGQTLHEPVIQDIVFHLVKTSDASGQENWICQNSPQTFPALQAFQIEGYTAGQNQAEAATVNWDENSRDLTTVISYHKNSAARIQSREASAAEAIVKFIDDTENKTIDEITKQGNPGEPIDFGNEIDTKISDLKSQNYQKASSTWTEGSEFKEGTTEFEIHFTHKTESVTEKQPCRVIYSYWEYGTDRSLSPAVTVDHTIDAQGEKDLVTGEITWKSGLSYTFPSRERPQIPGFIPQDTESVDKPLTVNFEEGTGWTCLDSVYYKRLYTGSLTIYDDTDNKILQTAHTPENNTDADYNLKAHTDLEYCLNNGYELISDSYQGKTLEWYPSTNEYEIHLKHKTEPFTHTKDVTRTIQYINDENGQQAADPYVQTVTFTESGSKDLVNGNITWSRRYEDQIFPSVESPYVPGLDCLQDMVPSKTLKYSDSLENETVTVHYQGRGKAYIRYIDDDQSGEVLYETSSEGSKGKRITFSSDPYAEILDFQNRGYELVSNSWNSSAEYDSTSTQYFEVHFKHRIQDVTRTQTVNFTYNYISSLDRQTVHPSKTVSKTMTQNGKKDLVTKAEVWEAAPSVHFDSFDLPKVEGYVSEQKTAEAMDYSFDPDSDPNYSQTFIYDPVYTCEIQIIDDTTGKVLQTLKTEADNTDPYPYLNQAKAIYDWETKGYDLVSDNSENQKLEPYPAQNSYEIHLEHNIFDEYETRTVTRTIHYVNAADQTDVRDPYTQSVNVMVKVSKDRVTNKSTIISVGQTSLSSWTSPEIANMKCMMPTVPEKKITTLNDLKNTDVYVNYVPENTAIVEFIDDDEDGKVIRTLSAQGINGEPIVFEEDPYEVLSHYMEKNYYYVSNTWQTGTKYQKDGSNHYEIHLKHKTEPVTDIHPVGTHIYYIDYTTRDSIYPDKEIDYDLVRTGTKDLVTGEVSWGPEPSWAIPVETVPKIEGYRPDVDKTWSNTLKFDDVDQGGGQPYIWKQYIPYRKIYTGSLKIIDDTTGKTLKTFETQIDEGNGPQNFTYDQNYNFNEDAVVKDYLNNGYAKVSNNYPGTLTWKANNQFEIHLNHKTDTKYRKETVSRTIHFVDQKGNSVKPDQVQTITFNLTDTVDQVTGETLKTECSNSPLSFGEIQAPKIENRSPLDSSVPALSVEYKDGLKNFEAAIRYASTRNAAISFVDDTTNTSLKEMTASGAEGSQINFEQDPDSVIQSYEAEGWKRVSSDWNNGSVYTSENKFTIHLTHNTVPYSETRTYTDERRFIDVDTNKEVAGANVRSVELTGTGNRDMVTGKITWTDTPSYTFPAIDIPKVAGYKNPDWDGQPYTVTFGGSSLKTTVPYKKVYSGTLKIIDDTDKKTLETLNITDSFSNAADFGQKGLLAGYLDQGYVLVSDNSENKTLEWQPAVNEYEIHLQHKKDPVRGTKTVKRFINYVNALNEETVAPSVTQSVTLNVEGVK